jgi:dTDP-4-amino-4,6-dideoxygalactose transaminase
MKVPFVNFGAQYLAHKEEFDEAMQKCLLNGRLILQTELEEFEENLAKFLGMKYAVGVANGTDAIQIALMAKMHGVSMELDVTDYTFKATHEAIHWAGHDIHRVDIEPETRMPKMHTHVPVHIEGMVHYSTKAIVEDACQAFGAKGVGYSGTACYSFYPAKIMGGPGDGGAIVTNNRDVYDLARLYRHHYQTGVDEQYAFNSRLDNIQAAYLNVRLKYIQEAIDRRKEIADKYLDELEGIVGLPYNQEGRVWQDFVVTHQNREGIVKYLRDNEIGVLGDGMVPNHVAFNSINMLPETERLYDKMFRLPLNETLTDDQIEYVIDIVKEYVPTV